MPKASQEFYLSNFVAMPASGTDPKLPRTEFANGAPIELAWESNGTWFQIYQKGDTAPIYAGEATNYTVSGGATTDTTFFLIASTTDNPSGDGTGFDAIYLYDALTVTIANPDLTPDRVSTTGNVSVGGPLTVQGAVSVAGPSAFGDVDAASLNVSGDARFGGATVNGLSATGTVAILSGAQAIDPANYKVYQTPTDGFCLGVITKDLGYQTTMAANAADALLGVTASSCQSLCLPVSAQASLICGTGPGNPANAKFHWVPFGTSSPLAEPTSDRKSKAVVPPHFTAPPPASSPGHPKDAILDELVSIIGLLTPKPVPAETRERLAGVLRMLNVRS